jgi:histone deacetylase 1/2
VCDACQQGKHHQLPYPRSTSVSTSPMELIFSDVWGPAPISVGKHTYYVSFIDDYTKFVWIYLIRQKFEVFFYVFKTSKISLNDSLIVRSAQCNHIGGDIKP